MADISINREHRLGLPAARRVAREWIAQVERELALRCSVEKGRAADRVAFSRPGVSGTLVVAADHFALDLRLGLVLLMMRSRIQSEIERRLDALLAAQVAAPSKPRRAAAPRAPRRR